MSNSPQLSLGDRLKNYENVHRNKLMRRTPVILRLDGCHFHTWTRGLTKPYDQRLVNVMTQTMKYLVDNIQCAVLGYTQSDEISIFLRDYDRFTTEAWFDNNIQKIVSVASSMATAFFNQHVALHWDDTKALATFDARVFNLPKEEVSNYFLWRQQDCTRNSIQSLGQAHLSHKKMQGMNNSAVQDALMELSPPINWNDEPVFFKRGVAYKKENDIMLMDWYMPIITECREYINQLVYLQE